MSSIIYNESIRIGSTENDRNFAVDRKQTEGLADYVRRVRNEKGFSLLDVQRHSRNQIAGSYVSRIENGIADPEGVTPKKLQALAKGLQVSEDEIFAVARGLSPNGEEPGELEHEVAVMFYGWKDASEEDRAVTLEALKMIAESFQRRRNKKKK